MDVASIGFRVDTKPLKAGEQALGKFGNAAGGAERRVTKASQRMSDSIERDVGRMNRALGVGAKLLIGFFSVQAVSRFTRELIQTADAYANIQGRLRLVTNGQDQLGRAMDRVFAISQRTFSSIDSTATLVARTTRALVSSGASQEQALEKSLQLSEAINNAFLVSGASAAESQNAIIQLTQGLAAGALRGEEFNSISEQGARISQSLAKYLGVTTGELRQLAADGKITSDVITNALLADFQTLQEEAGKMPLTLERALQQTSNAWTVLVGQLNEASRGTEGLGGYVQLLTQVLRQLTPLVVSLAQAWSTADTEQRDVAASAKGIVDGIKPVIAGVVLAKNVVDTLVEGLKVAGRVIVAWASGTVEAMRQTGRDLDALAEAIANPFDDITVSGVLEQSMEARLQTFQTFMAELDAASADFGEGFDQQVMDVTDTLDALFGPMERVTNEAGETANAIGDIPMGKLGDDTKKTKKALRDIAKELHDFRAEMETLAAELDGPLAVATLNHARAVERLQELYFEGLGAEEATRFLALLDKQLADTAAELEANSEEARWLQSILDDFNNTGMRGLIREIEKVGDALRDAQLTDQEKAAMLAYYDQLQVAAGDYRQRGLETMVGASQEVLRSIQGMSKEGSKAYKAMEVASSALNVVMAIGAILNQGKGDPYTAFARMAAMAAAVAGLVGSIANFGGGGGPSSASAEARQQAQGRGTVLGDADAQSESIANAIEITADATSELVGINRGMLNALQAMQAGISGAAAGISRFEFGEISLDSAAFADAFGPLPTILGTLLGSIFGGDQDLIDQGVLIQGGSFGDVSANPNASSYQTIETDGGWFSSDSVDDVLEGLGDDAANQIQLILESIGDAVREGAVALGLDLDAVNAAIDAFRIEEIRISTMDLTGEEAQRELEAAFSAIFDDLAGAVVPFIDQFQRVGEGLGETLVRVATSVQVTQEALMRLGLSLDETDPERFAQISVSLVELAGGIEQFIDGMLSFVDRFAPEAHKFEMLQSDLTRAFAQAGLEVPATRDAMWALMQTLDASTESGREQIATILRLSDVADEYYSELERQAQLEARILEEQMQALQEYADFVMGLDDQLRALDGSSDFQRELRNIAAAYNSNVDQLNDLAQAAGLAGAREQDLAAAMQLATAQRERAIAALEAEARLMADDLGYTELGQIQAELASLSSSASTSLGGLSGAIEQMGSTASDIANAMLGDFSPLRGRDKAAYALQALSRGDASLDQVLRVGRDAFKSGDDFNQFFNQAIEIARNAGRQGTGGGGGGSDSRREFLEQRLAELEAERAGAERFGQASELAQRVADLAGARGEDFGTIAERLGFTLDQLGADLGIGSGSELFDYLTTLQADAYGIDDLAAIMRASDDYLLRGMREIFAHANPIDVDQSPIMGDDTGFGTIPGAPGPVIASQGGSNEDAERRHNEVLQENRELRERVGELLERIAVNTDATANNTGDTADRIPELAEAIAGEAAQIAASAPRGNRTKVAPR